jgi:hypothetical protein
MFNLDSLIFSKFFLFFFTLTAQCRVTRLIRFCRMLLLDQKSWKRGRFKQHGKKNPKKVEKQFFVSIRQPTSKCHRYIFLDWYKLLRSSTQYVKALTKMKHSNSIFISSNLSMIYQILWHLDLGDQTSSQYISNLEDNCTY